MGVIAVVVWIGADDDIESAKAFIKNKYLSLVPVREHGAERNIYPHFTCSVGAKCLSNVTVTRFSFSLVLCFRQWKHSFRLRIGQGHGACHQSLLLDAILNYIHMYFYMKRKINVRSK